MFRYPISLTSFTVSMTLALGVSQSTDAAIDILPGQNNTPITSVVYRTMDNQIITQTNEASEIRNDDPIYRSDDPIYVEHVEVELGGERELLNVFNFEGAEVRNINFTANANRKVGVFTNGSTTNTSDLDAFANAVVGTTQDTDLRNYIYYDNSVAMPDSSTADFDLLFRFGLTSDDHVLVSERWGNTFFSLTALDADGDVIEEANVLNFGGTTTGGSFTRYDWRTGFASESYQPNQDQAFSVASVTKFFEGTSIADPVDQIVYGFRIDNNGQADVKFLGLSDNTFTDNPENPTFTSAQIPSPAAVWAGVVLIGGMTMRRTRKSPSASA